jgi:hypothetical protein
VRTHSLWSPRQPIRGDLADRQGSISSKERKEIRLCANRRLALSLHVSDDVVETRHRDLELSRRKTGHLRDRAGGCVELHCNPFSRECAYFDCSKDRPVKSARKDIHA